MKFLIVSHVVHKQVNDQYFAYGPYVKEMNLWFRYVDEVVVLAPCISNSPPDPIDLAYVHPKIKLKQVPEFNLLAWPDRIRTLLNLPGIFLRTLIQMKSADHIHLRCPGNMGLVGCFAQLFFPKKMKSAKYAGNWDPKSSQPFSYRLQKWILANPRLTKNMQVMVYGDWDPTNPNLRPFFTATYKQSEIQPSPVRSLSLPLKFIFVGSLSEGKNPLVSCQVVKLLNQRSLPCELHLFGEGSERTKIEAFKEEHSLDSEIQLHGNVNAETLIAYYQRSHYLLFVSKSEGWPKAVAEAMFWGCLPVTSPVSCVPEMVGFGSRGVLVNSDPEEIATSIEALQGDSLQYQKKAKAAMAWSREYTLEKFQAEIKSILSNG